MRQFKGHFIVIEGLEGAGKSTALTVVKEFLADKVTEIITTREPGGTQVGEMVRQILKLSLPNEPLEARSELLLLYAARVQLLERVILPALQRGCWVIADRFELSTWAYQGGGRKLDHKMIAHLSTFCLNGFKPDLVLFLDISPEVGIERIHFRGGQSDRIEQESLSFFNDVYEGYQKSIINLDNVVKIDAKQPLGGVQQQIHAALHHYFNKIDWKANA